MQPPAQISFCHETGGTVWEGGGPSLAQVHYSILGEGQALFGPRFPFLEAQRASQGLQLQLVLWPSFLIKIHFSARGHLPTR